MGIARITTATTAATFAALVVVLLPAPAGAATTIGQTFTPTIGLVAGSYLQSGVPAYAAPSPGVITSWSYEAEPTPTIMRFKVGRNTGGNNFTIVGHSELVTPTGGILNTFPTRISVQAGDVIGFHIQSTSFVALSTTIHPFHSIAGDPPVGSNMTWTAGSGLRFDVSAILEPDGDGDGFGDESQDQCPSDPSVQGLCPDTNPPETVIDDGPPKKTKSKSATLSYRGIDDRGLAGIECRLDGNGFEPCPPTAKIYAGLTRSRHTFEVRAVDLAGNVDPTPAGRTWKVKRKKKKKR